MRSLYSLILLPLLATGGAVEDQAVVGQLQTAEPELRNVIILKRLTVGENLDLVVVIGRREPSSFAPAGGFWWNAKDRLGLFLQDATKVYKLAIAPGPNDDCFARIERMTAQDLVLSCNGEKWSVYDNQKFVYDIRAKGLVKSFSYTPFRTSRIQPGPQFVMSDGKQSLLVSADFRIEAHPAADQPTAALTFGSFSLIKDSKRGLDETVIIERGTGGERRYQLPQTGSAGLALEMNEQIGAHQLEGDRLWFGKTFYASEGLTGTGGFGYFDTKTRSFRIYSPPEIQRWSVSAMLVEPDFIWLALYRRGEYRNSSGGLLRWDRKTEEVRPFTVHDVVEAIAFKGDSLYLGAVNGILVLRDDQTRSYFVDRTTDGRYQMAARDGASQ